MIGTAMLTVRENVHQMVDTLPEASLAEVLDYLAELSGPEETLSAETLAGIEEGLADIRGGRMIGLEEYRRTRGV